MTETQAREIRAGINMARLIAADRRYTEYSQHGSIANQIEARIAIVLGLARVAMSPLARPAYTRAHRRFVGAERFENMTHEAGCSLNPLECKCPGR